MSISERIALYKKLLDAVLSAGPDIQDDLTDLSFVRDAIQRIVIRTAKRFGKSAAAHEEVLGESQWKEIRNDPEVRNLEAQVRNLAAQKSAAPPGLPANTVLGAADAAEGKKLGATPPVTTTSGNIIDLLTQLFQFLLSNPALLQLIIQLFQKPTPAPSASGH